MIVALRVANAAMTKHFAAKNIEAYLEANVAFYNAIVQTANNEPLQRVSETLNEMAQPIRPAALKRAKPSPST